MSPKSEPNYSKEAFEVEALPFMNDLYRAAFRLVQDSSKASDAVQQAYLVAWKGFHRYERGTNCKAWLFQILFNVVRHERSSWFKWITGREEDVAESELASPVTIPSRLTDSTILKAIDRLSPQFRDVLLLVDVEEFTYKETSEILGVPIGTVMSRLNRARKILRGDLVEVARSYGLTVANAT